MKSAGSEVWGNSFLALRQRDIADRQAAFNNLMQLATQSRLAGDQVGYMDLAHKARQSFPLDYYNMNNKGQIIGVGGLTGGNYNQEGMNQFYQETPLNDDWWAALQKKKKKTK